MRYPLYAQRDERWRNVPLGQRSYRDDGSVITIGTDGCVVCSLASASGIMPVDLNQRLLETRQFSGANVTIRNIDYERVFLGQMRYCGSSIWFDGPVTDHIMNWLRRHLNDGGCAILCLDARPDMKGMQYHYVLAVGVADDGEIVVNDSWYNVTDKLNQINRVWWKRIFRGIYGNTSADAIYRVDLFKRNQV